MTLSPHLHPLALSTAVFLLMSPSTQADQPAQLELLVLQAQAQSQQQLDPLSESVLKSPYAIAVVDQNMIEQQQLKTLTDLAQQDPSLGEAYAPMGYYGSLNSRGFALDSSSSYLINGQTVRGEQNIAFENKQQVEILKGAAALLSPMATPGGVINYVTKRPEQIKQLSLQATEYGQVAAHLDLGGFSRTVPELGYRVNLAAERLKPYVQEADGERYFAALALDYQHTDQDKLEFDAEWQQQQQYSVPGYQLFNGQVPMHVKWDRWLGEQAWSKPVKNESFSSSLKYLHQWNDLWKADVSASFSQVIVDDYSSFPWGCYSEVCEIEGLGNQFDAQGHYDLYDFRSPDDTRRTLQFKTNVYGQWSGQRWQHDVQLGLEHTQKRQQQHVAINEWVGVGNAYTQPPTFAASQAELGPRYTALKSQQQSLTLLDHLRWHPQWSAVLGAKWLRLDEQAYAADGTQQRDTQKHQMLPQLALMYQPWQQAQLYASYREGISDGATAPWFADNAFERLAPRDSKQYELGYKQQWQDWTVTTAIFQLEQDYQYAQVHDIGFEYLQQGEQRSQGLEVGVTGPWSAHGNLSAQATWLKAQVQNVPEFKDQQMQNVPKFSALLQLSYQPPQVQGLNLFADARYSASKFADKTATVKVPSYTVMDLSAVYDFHWQRYPAQISLHIDNIGNKKYWRDVGDYMGDDYLFLGQPRTVKLGTQLKF